jgi:3-dehydroquinate synthase
VSGPGAPPPARVEVVPHAPRGYDVLVRAGALEDLAVLAAAHAPAARYIIIAPDDVAALYGRRVTACFAAAGAAADLLEFAAGEAHKTRATWAALTDRMLALRCGRDTTVVAVGGGVAGDLAGFVAATYMRGVPVIQVPTTLLAMIDASVGGKTGVDTDAGKNLVGAFHPPHLVVADPEVLRTLPPQEVRAGMAEAIKHGAMLDAAYFAWIERHADALLALDMPALEELITASVRIKAGIVMQDPWEHGIRAVLNFGHTIGHALELQAGYTLLHGCAVAVGMTVEAALGEAAGITRPGTRQRVAALAERMGLPTSPHALRAGELLEAMRLDKKARAARPRFALPSCIGEPARTDDGLWTHELPPAVLESGLGALSGSAGVV